MLTNKLQSFQTTCFGAIIATTTSPVPFFCVSHFLVDGSKYLKLRRGEACLGSRCQWVWSMVGWIQVRNNTVERPGGARCSIHGNQDAKTEQANQGHEYTLCVRVLLGSLPLPRTHTPIAFSTMTSLVD